MHKHVAIFIAATLAAFGVGCSKPSLCVIDTGSGRTSAIADHSGAFITRPMVVADDDRSFWTLGRPSKDKLQLGRISISGTVLETREIPVFTERYGGTDTALSSDGIRLAYTGVKPSRVEAGQVVAYDALLYVVAIREQVSRLIDGQLCPACSSGNLFWVDSQRLCVIPAASRIASHAELFDLASGKTTTLFPVGVRREAFPSLSFSKIAVVYSIDYDTDSLKVFSMRDGRLLREIPISTGKLKASSIAWADENVLYYVCANSIYKVSIEGGQPALVVTFDVHKTALLHAVDGAGNVHFTLRDVGDQNWSGDGWFVLDPRNGTWRRLADLHYVRNVLVTKDRRFLVISTGM